MMEDVCFPASREYPQGHKALFHRLKTCDNKHTDTQASCSQGQAATLTWLTDVTSD